MSELFAQFLLLPLYQQLLIAAVPSYFAVKLVWFLLYNIVGSLVDSYWDSHLNRTYDWVTRKGGMGYFFDEKIKNAIDRAARNTEICMTNGVNDQKAQWDRISNADRHIQDLHKKIAELEEKIQPVVNLMGLKLQAPAKGRKRR